MSLCVITPDLPKKLRIDYDQLFKEVERDKCEHQNIDEGSSCDCDDAKWSVSASTRVIATGKTGSGKTTLLLKLSTDWAYNNQGPLREDKAVFHILLKKLNYSSNLEDAIIQQLLSNTKFTRTYIKNFITTNQKHITILLDGYDEFKGSLKCGVGPNTPSGNIVKLLRNEYYPDARVLVTTRPERMNSFTELDNYFTDDYRRVDILGFSSSGIDKYINQVFCSRQYLARNLLEYLSETGLKMELACLPLMCCAYCQLTKLTDGRDFQDLKTMSSLIDRLLRCLIEYHPNSRNIMQYAATSSKKEHGEFAEKELSESDISKCITDIGQVALTGLLESAGEKMYFSRKDFKRCNKKSIEFGFKTGILMQDSDQLFTESFGLQTINENKKPDDIFFVFKIFQEKLAGMYLADIVLHKNVFAWRRVKKYFEGKSSKELLHLQNVFIFACGSNLESAKKIVPTVINRVLSDFESDDVSSFQRGELDYKKSFKMQKLMEFCLQLNFESQSQGKLNNALKPLLDIENGSIRLVQISLPVTRYLAYFLAYRKNCFIKSFELIRLHSDTEFAFRSVLDIFHGLEKDMGDFFKNRKENDEELLTEENRRKQLREDAVRGIYIPQHLIMMIPDDYFEKVMPLWQEVSQRREFVGSILPIIDELGSCSFEKLNLTGIQEENKDIWAKVVALISNPKFTTLQNLVLMNNHIHEEVLEQLVKAIKNQTSLKQLDLSGNKINAKFIQALSTNLPKSKLEALILQEASMSSEAIEVLGENLPQFVELHTLDIRMNANTSDSSLRAIFGSTHDCKKLSRLRISMYGVTINGYPYLQEKLRENPPLKELRLIHSLLPNDLLQCLAEGLPCMTYLEDLHVSGSTPDKSRPDFLPDCITQNVACQFSDALHGSRKLTFVSMLFIRLDTKCFAYFLDRCGETAFPKTIQ